MTTRKLSSAFVLFLAVALPSTHAYATELSVEQAVKEMQYSITTEWDQKDARKQREIYREFASKMDQIRDSGMSQSELIRQMKLLALTKQESKDLDAVAKYVVANRLSQKDATALLVRTMQNSATVEGTSWNPDGSKSSVVIGIVIGVVILAAIVVGVIACNNSDNCGFSKAEKTGLEPYDPTDDYPTSDDCTVDASGNFWCPPNDPTDYPTF